MKVIELKTLQGGYSKLSLLSRYKQCIKKSYIYSYHFNVDIAVTYVKQIYPIISHNSTGNT